MDEQELIREHCTREVEARIRWAEGCGEEWKANASIVSLKMLEEALSLPVEEQAERLFEAWKWRSGFGSDRTNYDRFDRRQWDAVVAGEPIDGNYSYFQTNFPDMAPAVRR